MNMAILSSTSKVQIRASKYKWFSFILKGLFQRAELYTVIQGSLSPWGSLGPLLCDNPAWY